ncbi:uncharacterized protein [Euphorbia lathyris]|uniref:uncharacterized protein n=1 Tax=Euphorbia lathyris TaxID=212925 RepID=UPI0033143BF4
MKLLIFFTIFILTFTTITLALTPCKTTCATIPIRYPFAVDDGCGAPQFRSMFNCSVADQSLFFTTPSGSYKVQNIDYEKKQIEIYDPAMSTCSILQPNHHFTMTELQSYLIPPTPDTVFALLNCSIDSPVLNRYRNLCFNFSGHSCDELYDSCNAFRVFRGLVSNNNNGSDSNGEISPVGSGSGGSSSPVPACCFTGYDTVKYMSMDILDCSHYTTVVNSDDLRGIGPLDWVYGIKLSFSMPENGCRRCTDSGGTCGFDTETEGMLCLCSASSNATRECGVGSITAGGGRGHSVRRTFHVFVLVSSVLLVIFGLW